MFSAGNIHYDIADRAGGLAYGGVGGIHLAAKRTGLMKAIDENLELLKRHLPLYLINRTGNCTSSHNAAEHINKAIDLCRRSGVTKILMIRGGTDFSQTKHLDRWDDQNVKFVFGIEYSHGTHR